MLQRLVLAISVLIALPLLSIYCVTQVALAFGGETWVGGISRGALSRIYPLPAASARQGRFQAALGRYVMPLDSRHLFSPDPAQDPTPPAAEPLPDDSVGASIEPRAVCVAGDVEELKDNLSYLLGLDLEIAGNCFTEAEIQELLAALSER